MYPLIRNSLVIVFFCLFSSSLQAGDGQIRPQSRFLVNSSQLTGVDSFLNRKLTGQRGTENTESSSGLRICSCQILNLESSNYDHRAVVLLAEKSSSGKNSDFRKAKDRIQKEKKHLKELFYDKIRVVAETEATGSCKSLFFRLKHSNDSLQLYEILNADTN